MNSVDSGTFVAVTSITCTIGGGGAAGAAFLQEVVVIAVRGGEQRQQSRCHAKAAQDHVRRRRGQ